MQELDTSSIRSPLNVAVIGQSGVGKSSFINAIRGLTANDEGAAAVDVVETTADITSYTHPKNELLELWDLPGMGTQAFPKDEYLEMIRVDRYDFFLLLSATRFTEDDTWLCNEIDKRGKKLYYVRTKVGNDVRSHKKSHPRTHNENDVLAKIHTSTVKHLERCGIDHTAKVFLIDNYKRHEYDFHKLEQRLLEDFHELNSEASLLRQWLLVEAESERNKPCTVL